MPKGKKTAKSKNTEPQTLTGWKAIGEYLGIGQTAAQRWAKSGMPVRREGRFTVADVNEIRQWLGREAHMPAPAQVVTEGTDLSAALKQSISALRRDKRSH
jgi:hypothetical protein